MVCVACVAVYGVKYVVCGVRVCVVFVCGV